MKLQDFRCSRSYIETFQVLDEDKADKFVELVLKGLTGTYKSPKRSLVVPGFIKCKAAKGFFVNPTTINWNLPN